MTTVHTAHPAGAALLGEGRRRSDAMVRCTYEATRPILSPTGRVAHPRHPKMTQQEDRAPEPVAEGESPLHAVLFAVCAIAFIPAMKWLTVLAGGVQW